MVVVDRKEDGKMHTLNELKVGNSTKITSIKADGGLKRRFLDIGLIDDTLVTCVAVSPQGVPKAFLIRGAVIGIRNCDSKNICVGDIYE